MTTIKIDKDLEDLIPDYLERRRTDILSIQNAAGAHDFETVRIIGHTMKGSGGGYGFDRITEIGGLLEEAAKRSHKTDILRCVGELSAFLEDIEIVYE